MVVHARYNPEQITALNIVPGLIGTILMMSTLVITTLSITREREAGTMENLLAMPIRPIEVMLGKIVPYVGLGYVQVLLIVGVSALAFQVPMRGSLLVLLVALGVFIAGNLALGITFSTLARTQQQAQQLAQFSLLPQMMLSGFMFPFQGMPGWARAIGELLPLTHILRICRGVMLKGNGFAEILPNMWPMALFAAGHGRGGGAVLPRDAGLIATSPAWWARERLRRGARESVSGIAAVHAAADPLTLAAHVLLDLITPHCRETLRATSPPPCQRRSDHHRGQQRGEPEHVLESARNAAASPAPLTRPTRRGASGIPASAPWPR